MGYASISGRASTSPKNPRAHAICDRCGFRYNHINLRWQYDWRGASLQNIRLLVCNTCYDAPQEQLRAIVVPADPVPIVNPRVQDFVTAETNTRYTSGTSLVPLSGTGNGSTVTLTLAVPDSFPAIAVGSTVIISGMEPAGFNKTAIVTACTTGNPYTISYASSVLGPLVIIGKVQINIDPTTGLPLVGGDVRVTSFNNQPTSNDRVTQMTGEADFGFNQLPGTDPNAVSYRNIIDMTNNGGIIRLTVTTTSGFITGQKVLVGETFGVTGANDVWTITVINDQQLDLQGSVFSGSYTGGGYVINSPSVPYGFDEIPRTGPLWPFAFAGVRWVNNSSQYVGWVNNYGQTVLWI
jgi:hypothetical protein